MNELEDAKKRFRQAWDDLLRLSDDPCKPFTVDPIKFHEPTVYGIWHIGGGGYGEPFWLADDSGRILDFLSMNVAVAHRNFVGHGIPVKYLQICAIGPDGLPVEASANYDADSEGSCLPE